MPRCEITNLPACQTAKAFSLHLTMHKAAFGVTLRGSWLSQTRSRQYKTSKCMKRFCIMPQVLLVNGSDRRQVCAAGGEEYLWLARDHG